MNGDLFDSRPSKLEATEQQSKATAMKYRLSCVIVARCAVLDREFSLVRRQTGLFKHFSDASTSNAPLEDKSIKRRNEKTIDFICFVKGLRQRCFAYIENVI